MNTSKQWQFTDAASIPALEDSRHKDSTIAIRSERTENAETYQAVIMDPHSASRDFFDILNHASPSKLDPQYAVQAVKSDWKMPDETTPESKRLQTLHKNGLKGLWSLFERHRKKFLDALEVAEIFPSVEEKYRTQSEVESDIYQFLQNKPDLLEFFHRLHFGNEEHLMRVLREWRKEQVGRKGKKRIPADNAFNNWTSKQLQQAKVYVSRSSIEPQARQIAFSMKGENFWNNRNDQYAKITPLGSEPLYVYDWHAALISAANAHTRNEVVKNGGYEAKVSLEKQRNILRARFHIIENQAVLRRKLFPLLQWNAGPDGRQWMYEDLDGESFSSLEPALPKSIPFEYDKKQADPLFGLITITGTRQDLVESWPKVMALPKGRYNQILGPAQIPVLAPMKERAILKDNALLDTLEDIAKSGAASED